MQNRDIGPNDYGALLREYRLLSGLTQNELGALAGVSPRTISDLERGIHKVPFEHTATAIAGALELAPAQVDAMRAAIKLTRKTAAFHSIKALTDSRESLQPNRLGMSPGITILSG